MDSRDNQWFACERGKLDDMVAMLKTEEITTSRRNLLRLLATGSLMGTGVFLVARPPSRDTKSSVPQIPCATVHQNLKAFVNDQLADRHFKAILSRHLFTCTNCQKAYRGLINDADFECG